MSTPIDRPYVSVALATYNGEAHLGEQLRSIAGQSLLPAELVVSDDGSTDRTIELIKEFARTSPFPVRFTRDHERFGFSDNFLFAAEHCSGDYIAFSDQDDGWLPTKLEEQFDRMFQESSLLSMHCLALADGNLRPTGEVWTQDITSDRAYEPLELQPYRTGWGNSMLFDKRLVHLIPRERRPCQPEGNGLPLSHDTWIYTLAAALGRVSHMTKSLVLYRQHDTNTYGVGPIPLRIRLRILTSVHFWRFLEEQSFNETMANLFDEVGRSGGVWSIQASSAARAFQQRASLCQLRSQVYSAETFSERLSAYRSVRRTPGYHPWLGSDIKEFILGVLGASKKLPFTRK